jgi:hypothetical protein
MTAVQFLFDRLIDYAGLFPPAELQMSQAVENYLRYLRSPERWMLGRFILPVSRLGEFEEALDRLPSERSDELPWRLSALLPPHGQTPQFERDISAVADFNARQNQVGGGASSSPRAIIDTLEGKAADARDVNEAAKGVPAGCDLFLEVALGSGLDELLTAIRHANDRRPVMAKVRTGGVVADAIPIPPRLAAFVAGCASRDLGFKATAGLHHAIRASYRLTYRDPSPCGVMFGFVNVFVAALAAYDNPKDLSRIEAILTESDPAQFAATPGAIGWRDAIYQPESIRRVRSRALAFGSCSFEEPIEDLKKLQWLS